MKKLIPALAMLLVAAVLMGTSTYAWFSMNTTVSATGMQVTATTPVNLLISNAEAGTYANTAAQNENYSGKLYPASSNTAKVFNAIKNSGNYINSGNGGAAENGTTTFQITSGQAGSGVIAMAGSADGYWATYDFWVKLSDAQTSAKKVYLSGLEVAQTYIPGADHTVTSDEANRYYTDIACTSAVAVGGTLTNGETYYVNALRKSVRVALLAGGTNGSLKTIYAVSGATDPTPAVDATYTAETIFDGSTTNYIPTTSYAYDANYAVDVNDSPVQLTFVVWIEGQDAACVNANAGATIAVAFELSVNG